MFHLCGSKKVKDKKRFFVVNIGDNGEVLSTSETFTRKANAWKNIRAQMKSVCVMGNAGRYVAVQDDTRHGIPEVYKVYSDGKMKSGIRPERVYAPKPRPIAKPKMKL